MDKNSSYLFSDDALEQVKKYHTQREFLRELLHRVGENRLIVKRSNNWEQLKKEHAVFRDVDCASPFSFLLDHYFTNPVASINHHRKAIWGALHIANEFIEYLSYDNPDVGRKIEECSAPNPALKPTR